MIGHDLEHGDSISLDTLATSKLEQNLEIAVQRLAGAWTLSDITSIGVS